MDKFLVLFYLDNFVKINLHIKIFIDFKSSIR